MKIILYLFGGVLVAPGAVLAYGFWTLIEAIHQDDFFKMLFYLFTRALQILEWGGWLIPAGAIVWLVLAFWRMSRVVGAFGTALVAAVSLAELLVVTGPPKAPGELFIPALSLVGLLIELWLVWDGARAPSAAR